MTYGALPKTDWQNLVTVRPGPVLHVWRSGSEFCVVPLDYHSGLALIGSITAALQFAERPATKTIDWGVTANCPKCGEFRGHGHECKTLPNESLPFDEHMALRDAERAKFEAEGAALVRKGMWFDPYAVLARMKKTDGVGDEVIEE